MFMDKNQQPEVDTEEGAQNEKEPELEVDTDGAIIIANGKTITFLDPSIRICGGWVRVISNNSNFFIVQIVHKHKPNLKVIMRCSPICAPPPKNEKNS